MIKVLNLIFDTTGDLHPYDNIEIKTHGKICNIHLGG